MSTESISEHLVQIWHVLQTSRVFHSFVVVFSVNAMKPFQLRRRRRYYIHRKRNDIQPLHNEFEAAAKEIQFRDEMQMRTVWIETRVETRERKVPFCCKLRHCLRQRHLDTKLYCSFFLRQCRTYICTISSQCHCGAKCDYYFRCKHFR